MYETIPKTSVSLSKEFDSLTHDADSTSAAVLQNVRSEYRKNLQLNYSSFNVCFSDEIPFENRIKLTSLDDSAFLQSVKRISRSVSEFISQQNYFGNNLIETQQSLTFGRNFRKRITLPINILDHNVQTVDLFYYIQTDIAIITEFLPWINIAFSFFAKYSCSTHFVPLCAVTKKNILVQNDDVTTKQRF